MQEGLPAEAFFIFTSSSHVPPPPPPISPPRPCSSFFRLFFNITIKIFLFGKPVNIVFILGQALVLSAVYVLTPLILKQSNEVSIITPPVFR